MSKPWHLYIARCKNGSYYTGITTNVKRRLFEHNNKIGAKSLKGKLPVELVYSQSFENQIEAARREREIKGWSRKKKEILIKDTLMGL